MLAAANTGDAVQALATDAFEAICTQHDMEASPRVDPDGHARARVIGSGGALAGIERGGRDPALREVDRHVSAVRGRAMRSRLGALCPQPGLPAASYADQMASGRRSVSYKPSVVALRT
jgi:hypothetical protein